MGGPTGLGGAGGVGSPLTELEWPRCVGAAAGRAARDATAAAKPAITLRPKGAIGCCGLDGGDGGGCFGADERLTGFSTAPPVKWTSRGIGGGPARLGGGLVTPAAGATGGAAGTAGAGTPDSSSLLSSENGSSGGGGGGGIELDMLPAGLQVRCLQRTAEGKETAYC